MYASPLYQPSIECMSILLGPRAAVAAEAGPPWGPGWRGGAGDSDSAFVGAFVDGRDSLERRFVEEGLDAALERKKQTRLSRARVLDGEGEARLIQLACSKPPEGRCAWTLNMLSEELVALNVVDSISPQTVRRTLKKMNFDPTCANAG